jgi:hypothetical protein
MKKSWLSALLALAFFFAFHTDTYAVSLRAKVGPVTIDEMYDGQVKKICCVYVPKGGQVGVYMKNTNSFWDGPANLDIQLLTTDGYGYTSFLSDDYLTRGEVLNQRVTSRGNHQFYLLIECSANPGNDCDGTVTLSSWY